MPFLDWVNKNQATLAASQVPYRLLTFQGGYGDGAAAGRNLILQGDNLEALKALVPFYAGQVKCIYADPPFNTEQAFADWRDAVRDAVLRRNSLDLLAQKEAEYLRPIVLFQAQPKGDGQHLRD